MPNDLRIEPASESTFEKLLPLIGQYQNFYGRNPDEMTNRKHFSRLLEKSNPIGIQFIALRNQDIVGFSTLYFVPSSVSATIQCLLNDLYTIPQERGRGVGRALIEYSGRYAKDLGYGSMSWQTQKSNQVAQHLYDSLKAEKSDWLEYSLPLNSL